MKVKTVRNFLLVTIICLVTMAVIMKRFIS